MIRQALLFLMILMAHTAFANVAVDELNMILLKKASRTQKSEASIQELSENYYFVFIYKSSCLHCQKFAPILKDFSETFHLKVQAFSLDDKSLHGFDSTPLTSELFQTFYVSGGYKPSVPALFLVNRHTLEAYAVLFGEASPYQLARRVHELQRHIEEKFHD